jgi:hypothetical protein
MAGAGVNVDRSALVLPTDSRARQRSAANVASKARNLFRTNIGFIAVLLTITTQAEIRGDAQTEELRCAVAVHREK